MSGQSQGAHVGRSGKSSYWRRLVGNLRFMAIICFLGYVYLAVAVTYDLTVGNGVGPAPPRLALLLVGAILVGAVYLTAIGDEPDQPTQQRQAIDREAVLRFEPRLIPEITTPRWKALHGQLHRVRRRRIGALCLWIPLAVFLTGGLAVGGAWELDQWLPESPWFRIPALLLFVTTVLVMSVTAVNSLVVDVRYQPTFVVGIITEQLKLAEHAGVLNTIPVLTGTKGEGVRLAVTNLFQVSPDGRLNGLPRGPRRREFPCSARLRRRLFVGDAVVLVVMPDGRAVARLVDL